MNTSRPSHSTSPAREGGNERGSREASDFRPQDKQRDGGNALQSSSHRWRSESDESDDEGGNRHQTQQHTVVTPERRLKPTAVTFDPLLTGPGRRHKRISSEDEDYEDAARETDQLTEVAGADAGVRTYFGLNRLAIAFKADVDQLRYELEELRSVRQIMIEGNSNMVARLLLQFQKHELSFRNEWLQDYMGAKVRTVEASPAKIVFETKKLGEMEVNLSPEAGAHGRTEPRKDALERAGGMELMINVYGRASTESIIRMGDQMANINNIIATREALSLKILGAKKRLNGFLCRFLVEHP
jgi:hypothetical protein